MEPFYNILGLALGVAIVVVWFVRWTIQRAVTSFTPFQASISLACTVFLAILFVDVASCCLFASDKSIQQRSLLLPLAAPASIIHP